MAEVQVDIPSKTITITCLVRASPKTLFTTVYSPTYIKQYQSQPGYEVTSCDMDLRPGGSFKAVASLGEALGGGEDVMTGQYEIVEEYKRERHSQHQTMSGMKYMMEMTYEEREGGKETFFTAKMEYEKEEDIKKAVGEDDVGKKWIKASTDRLKEIAERREREE